MTGLLQTLLAERDWLLADGATGTNLFAMGLQHGDAPELWNLEEPEKIKAHYRSYAEAGSDIILTNTFGGTANRLKLHKADDRVYEINRAAAALLRQVIAETGRAIVCAGSVGPTGELFEPIGPLTHADGVAAFTAQMQGLKDGGADVAWIETMSAEAEIRAALEAARTVGLPAVVTLSFDTNGRTMMGLTPLQLASIVASEPAMPVGYGGNCGTGAPDLLAGLITLQPQLAPGTVLIAKANCGIPEFADGEIRYSGTPELMQRYAVLARNLGARIIGGCCGTTPAHVKAMRAVLEATPKGTAPTLEEVTAAIGPLTGSTEDLFKAHDPDAPTRDRRRRRH